MATATHPSHTATRYTVREEIANATIHGVGFALAVAGTAILTVNAVGALSRWSAVVFGITLMLLYAASTLYHAVSHVRAKRVLRIFDHAAIYLLIAGTYTPVLLLAVGGRTGFLMLIVVWLLAILGVVLSLVSLRRFRVLSMILYLGMGWMMVVAGRPLLANLDLAGLALIFAGGVAYTGGLAFYAWRGLPYGHSFWHACVLTGSVFHFVAVTRIL